MRELLANSNIIDFEAVIKQKSIHRMFDKRILITIAIICRHH